jgi:hypothetical protein
MNNEDKSFFQGCAVILALIAAVLVAIPLIVKLYHWSGIWSQG